MNLKSIAIVATAAIMSCAPMIASAAKPVKPPSAQLQTERNQIAVINVEAVNKRRITIKSVETLHGDAFDKVEVVLPDNADVTPAVGDAAIVAFSYYSKDPITRDVWLENEDGARVLDFSEVKAAWFPAHDELRAVLNSTKSPDAHTRISSALALAAKNDRASVYFGVIELFIDDSLIPHYDATHIQQLKTLVSNKKTTDHVKGLLLRVAATLPANTTSFLADVARNEINRLGNQYELATYAPALVLACTTILEQRGTEQDAKLLANLLQSNAPAVTKSALRALNHISPALAKSSAEEALSKPNLSADGKRSLQAYLKGGVVPG